MQAKKGCGEASLPMVIRMNRVATQAQRYGKSVSAFPACIGWRAFA